MSLTPRQKRVRDLSLEGLSALEVANVIGVHRSTVKKDRRRIRDLAEGAGSTRDRGKARTGVDRG